MTFRIGLPQSLAAASIPTVSHSDSHATSVRHALTPRLRTMHTTRHGNYARRTITSRKRNGHYNNGGLRLIKAGGLRAHLDVLDVYAARAEAAHPHKAVPVRPALLCHERRPRATHCCGCARSGRRHTPPSSTGAWAGAGGAAARGTRCGRDRGRASRRGGTSEWGLARGGSGDEMREDRARRWQWSRWDSGAWTRTGLKGQTLAVESVLCATAACGCPWAHAIHRCAHAQLARWHPRVDAPHAGQKSGAVPIAAIGEVRDRPRSTRQPGRLSNRGPSNGPTRRHCGPAPVGIGRHVYPARSLAYSARSSPHGAQDALIRGREQHSSERSRRGLEWAETTGERGR